MDRSQPVGDDDQRCPVDPYTIVADKSDCIDQQVLKVQELPEFVPTGKARSTAEVYSLFAREQG